MEPVIKSVPRWARPAIERFKRDRESPFPGSIKVNLSAQDSIEAGWSADDFSWDIMQHSGRSGDISVRFREKDEALELGASLEGGKTAHYFNRNEESTIAITLSYGDCLNEVLYLDHRQPERSYVILKQ